MKKTLLIGFTLMTLSCAYVDYEKTTDPTERGLAYIASAIVVSSIIRAAGKAIS